MAATPPQSHSTRPAPDAEAGCLWSASEGQVVNAVAILLCVATFWLVVPVVYLAVRMLRTWRHQWTLTDQRLREFRGLIFRDVEELELYRVKDISIQQPPMQALFGRGRVILRTSDQSTPTVILNAIPRPLAVADVLRVCIERCRDAKGVRELDTSRSIAD